MRRHIRKMAVICLVLISAGLCLSAPSCNPPSRDHSGTSSLRIATANLNYQNPVPGQAAAILAELDLDVLILLEWTGSNADLSVLKRSDLVPILNEPRIGTHGLCVLVRSGLRAEASLVRSPVSGPCRLPLAAIRLQGREQAVSILGVHVPPPVTACKQTTQPTIDALAAWVRGGRLVEQVGVARKNDRLVIAGDFNALPVIHSLRRLEENGLADAYADRNWRPGTTWTPVRWLPSFLRLDYIFVSEMLDIEDCRVLNIPGSDHRAVVADITL